MANEIIKWNIYEISSKGNSLNGVMLRGRIRKLGIEKNFNVLAENTEDVPNGVRFAVMKEGDAKLVSDYIRSVIDTAVIELRLQDTINPVLSKLKVNIESRYKL